jgi:hypothetical protein
VWRSAFDATEPEYPEDPEDPETAAAPIPPSTRRTEEELAEGIRRIQKFRPCGAVLEVLPGEADSIADRYGVSAVHRPMDSSSSSSSSSAPPDLADRCGAAVTRARLAGQSHIPAILTHSGDAGARRTHSRSSSLVGANPPEAARLLKRQTTVTVDGLFLDPHFDSEVLYRPLTHAESGIRRAHPSRLVAEVPADHTDTDLMAALWSMAGARSDAFMDLAADLAESLGRELFMEIYTVENRYGSCGHFALCGPTMWQQIYGINRKERALRMRADDPTGTVPKRSPVDPRVFTVNSQRINLAAMAGRKYVVHMRWFENPALARFARACTCPDWTERHFLPELSDGCKHIQTVRLYERNEELTGIDVRNIIVDMRHIPTRARPEGRAGRRRDNA